MINITKSQLDNAKQLLSDFANYDCSMEQFGEENGDLTDEELELYEEALVDADCTIHHYDLQGPVRALADVLEGTIALASASADALMVEIAELTKENAILRKKMLDTNS